MEDKMKLVLGLLLFTLLVSCSGPFGFNPMGYDVNNMPLEEAWPRVAALEYIPDIDSGDVWKSPRETLRDGGGDCEDFAIYLMYLLGPDSIMEIVYNANDYHAIVEYHGLHIEPHMEGMFYTTTEFVLLCTYDYYYVMEYATNHGRE
jgi:hypothetical protein